MSTLDPAFILTGAQFNQASGRFLYEWWRGSECLYVGISDHFWNRIGTHHVIGKKDRVLDTDEIRTFRMDNITRKEAERVEADRIRELRPKHCIEHSIPRRYFRPVPCLECRAMFLPTKERHITCSPECGER